MNSLWIWQGTPSSPTLLFPPFHILSSVLPLCAGTMISDSCRLLPEPTTTDCCLWALFQGHVSTFKASPVSLCLYLIGTPCVVKWRPVGACWVKDDGNS